ncbi:MAG TPA: hypothetical protein PLO37_14745 [Candidatus Hydrogenedentes bacterium]|nr:hypothetical protein [Candidatus Hydrogenedentota bacterium]HPG68104.1 hypothetical protein [Candidatus Hydrogenedentota bacterium]
MRKRSAIAVAVLMPCVAYLVVVFFTERVFFDTRVPPGRENRAALAIRDNVTPFQKWGSKISTVGYLRRYYDQSWYFTQSNSDGQRQAFVDRLNKALEAYPQVDLIVLAHTNKVLHWVTYLPAERRAHLHLVYNTGCHNLPQAPEWLRLGAKAYVGHPGKSASSVFYFYFLRRWVRGETLRPAVDESNRLMRLRFGQAQPFSLGHLNAAKLMYESEAVCNGDSGLRVEDCAL